MIGLLLVKMLIRTDMCEKKSVRALVPSLLTPRFCLKVTPLYTALNQFFIVKSKTVFIVYTNHMIVMCLLCQCIIPYVCRFSRDNFSFNSLHGFSFNDIKILSYSYTKI